MSLTELEIKRIEKRQENIVNGLHYEHHKKDLLLFKRDCELRI